jgi:hypothetical protein
MCLVYRRPLLPLAALVLLGLPCAASAGTITYGGDLLEGSVATPPLLEGGATLDVPFGACVPGLGRVSGRVLLENGAATAGVIRLVDLQFQSLRPLGAGDVGFTLAVDQDFAYAGPPQVDGAFSLSGSTTFTADPQSSGATVAGYLGVVLDPLPFTFASDPQAPFPQEQAFGTAGGLAGLPAEETMSLRLFLSLRLSDNALSPGPRFEAPGGRGEFVSIGYTAGAAPNPGPPPAPNPEPSALTLLGLGALGLLGYAWRCRQRTASGSPATR